MPQAGGEFYTVRRGDTLYSISRRYGVDMSTVVRLNALEAPYAIKPGQRLALPAPVVVSAPASAAASQPGIMVPVAAAMPGHRQPEPAPAPVMIAPVGAPVGGAPVAAVPPSPSARGVEVQALAAPATAPKPPGAPLGP